MKLFISMLLALFLVMGGMVGVAFAQEEEAFKFDPYNIQGDLLYLTDQNTFATGVGVSIATIYDVVEIRAEAAFVVDSSTEDQDILAGIGLGVDIKKLVEKVNGTWKLPDIIPSVGVVALVNMVDKPEIKLGFYLSIVGLEF